MDVPTRLVVPESLRIPDTVLEFTRSDDGETRLVALADTPKQME